MEVLTLVSAVVLLIRDVAGDAGSVVDSAAAGELLQLNEERPPPALAPALLAHSLNCAHEHITTQFESR